MPRLALVFLRFGREGEAGMDIVRRVPSPLRWMRLKRTSSGRNAANWKAPAWLDLASSKPCSRWFAAPQKLAGTIRALAVRARNTRSAAARKPNRQFAICVTTSVQLLRAEPSD